jgi:DNA-binding MarR family transcriptional regulator
MEAGKFADDDWQLWITLRNAAHKTARIRNDELRKYGISFIQAAILYIVKNADVPVTPSEISRWMDREPQTITEILNRMHKSGLIHRVKDLAKKNQVRIELTQKGEQAYSNGSSLASIHSILSCLSTSEKQDMKNHLKKIDETADEYSNNLL